MSFTGHRPDKIAGWAAAPTATECSIRGALRGAIVAAVAEGAEVFNSGAAPGIDLWAADEVLRLRAEGTILSSTRLILWLPYSDFSGSFGAEDRALYDSIVERLGEGDEVVSLADHYHHGCYNVRNDRMATECDLMVAYYEGTAGGTRYTLRSARKQGCQIINLFEGELFG